MRALALMSLGSSRSGRSRRLYATALCGWELALEFNSPGAPRAARRAAPAGREPVRRELQARSPKAACYLLVLRFPNTLEPRFAVPISESATDLGWSKISETVLKTQSCSSDGVAVLFADRSRQDLTSIRHRKVMARRAIATAAKLHHFFPSRCSSKPSCDDHNVTI